VGWHPKVCLSHETGLAVQELSVRIEVPGGDQARRSP
jgi:hypothetical protein